MPWQVYKSSEPALWDSPNLQGAKVNPPYP